MADLDRAMQALLERRRQRLAAGEQALGWKAGFGSAAARQQLGTDGPLVAALTRTTLLEPGAAVSLDGFASPMLEPEVAVYVDADGGVREVGLAFEVVDLDTPPADPASILGGDIYHRYVVLGAERGALDGLRARVWRNGEEVAATDDVAALNGSPADVARLVAETVGGELRAGDVVIAGSVVPPIPVAAGDRFRYELAPIGSLELSFSASSASS